MLVVRAIAVIGAGRIGRSIAHASALAGYRTILEDILPASLRRAEIEIRSSLEDAVARGQVREEDAGAALARIEFASTVEEAARAADLVIEAVPEELESKIEIFTLLDKVCKPHTILVSNTSSLSITDIASVTYRPQRCVAMRFSNSSDPIRLLEIVRAPETDDETIAVCAELARRMGQKAIILTDPMLREGIV